MSEVVSEESFESLLGLVDGGTRKLSHVLAMDEEILHLSGGQIRDVEVGIVLAELAHPSGIGLDGFGL